MLKYWEYLRTQVFGYLLKFGVVGVFALVIDIAVFNVISILVPNSVPFIGGPIGAKIISTLIATVFAWFGNRYWTFREHRRSNYILELLEFSAVSGVGMLISIFCLWVSHYALGFQSLLADNVSTNLIGFSIATAFRFLMYRYWVFGVHRERGLRSEPDTTVTAAALAIFEDESEATRETEVLSLLLHQQTSSRTPDSQADK